MQDAQLGNVATRTNGCQHGPQLITEVLRGGCLACGPAGATLIACECATTLQGDSPRRVSAICRGSGGRGSAFDTSQGDPANEVALGEEEGHDNGKHRNERDSHLQLVHASPVLSR